MINQHKRMAMGESIKGYAEGGTVKAPPPPESGGLLGVAQRALRTRSSRLDDAESKAVGKRRGGSVKKS